MSLVSTGIPRDEPTTPWKQVKTSLETFLDFFRKSVKLSQVVKKDRIKVILLWEGCLGHQGWCHNLLSTPSNPADFLENLEIVTLVLK